jgi:Ca2+-binding EF-hand superfamily protein
MKGISMYSRKFAVSALILGSAVAVSAIGAVQAASQSATEQFKTWDTDHDGTIDLSEAQKAAEARFNSLDSDHDGTVDAKEFKSAKITQTDLIKADTDKDGTVDKDEYLKLVAARFKAADTDNDGTVSVDELQTKDGAALARLL